MTNTPKPQANTLDEIDNKMFNLNGLAHIVTRDKIAIQALITEARKEGRMQMGEKINKYAERADFFKPDAEVVLASTMVWLSGLNEKENK